jgi:hypothetical protein
LKHIIKNIHMIKKQVINIGKWHDQIQKELEEIDFIIFMLSANFFSSNYFLENEVKRGTSASHKILKTKP